MFGSVCFLGYRLLKFSLQPQRQFGGSSCVQHQKLKKPPLLILENDKKPSSCHICHYMTAIRTLHAGKDALRKRSPCSFACSVVRRWFSLIYLRLMMSLLELIFLLTDSCSYSLHCKVNSVSK